MMDDNNRDPRVLELLVKATDDVMTDDERREWLALVDRDPTLAQELDSMLAGRSLLSAVRVTDPNPDDFEHFEKAWFPRSERVFGWIALLVGYVILVGLALFEFFADPQVSTLVKTGVGAIVLGFAVLFVHVGRRFFNERKKDPYKEVIR